MSGIITIVQILGWILLIALAMAAAVLLLILLVPIHYKAQLQIEDPEAHDEADWTDLKDRVSGGLICSWFGPLVRASVTYKDTPYVDVRIMWRHLDVMSMSRRNTGITKEKDRTAQDQENVPGIGARVKALYRKADYYWRVLRKEETSYSLHQLCSILHRTLRHILPVRWQMNGSIGLGDPAATARVLEIQGMLYPVLTDHTWIEPVFMQYQMDIMASAEGRIRLIHLLAAVVSAAADRRIRRTVRRLRSADSNIAAHYHQADRAMRQPENA